MYIIQPINTSVHCPRYRHWNRDSMSRLLLGRYKKQQHRNRRVKQGGRLPMKYLCSHSVREAESHRESPRIVELCASFRITPLTGQGSWDIYTLTLLVIGWGLILRMLIPWHFRPGSPRTEQPSRKAFRHVAVLLSEGLWTEGYGLGTDRNCCSYFVFIGVGFHVL